MCYVHLDKGDLCLTMVGVTPQSAAEVLFLACLHAAYSRLYSRARPGALKPSLG